MSETPLRIKTPRWATPLLGKSRYKGAVGGRGSGKSHFFAELTVEAHVSDPSRSTVCVRENQKSLQQSVKRLIEQKIESLGAGHYFEVQESIIKNTHGPGRIIFQGMQSYNAESIKSLEGYDCAWVEEAQSLSQRSLDFLRPTIRKPGSELWFSWNRMNENDPIEKLLCGESPPAGSVVVEVNYDQNPWFPDVLRDEMEYDKRRDPDKYQHVWLGGFLRNSECRVFRNWKVDEFEAAAGAVHRLGADWGFSVDPTVLVRCHIVGRTLYVDYEAYRVGCEIVDTPDLFMTIPQAEKWPIISDNARPETISYMRAHGFPKIMATKKGAGSVEDGIEWLKSFDIVVHPRCKHVADELSLYSYKVDKHTGAVLPKLADEKNHCIAEGQRISCRRGLVPIEQVTVGDEVMTRNGYRRVLFSGCTDVDRDIVKVTTDSGSFLCTPDHKIWTENGWTRADALRYGDELWRLKQQSGVARRIVDTRRAVGAQIGSTLSAATGSFIAWCGSTIMEAFQGVCTFITLMATPVITTPQTLSWSPYPSIGAGTLLRGSDYERRERISTGLDLSQRPGMPRLRAEQGTGRLARLLTKTLFPFQRLVNNAGSSLIRERMGTSIASAQTRANPHGDARPVPTTSSEHANRAVKASRATSIRSPKIARARVLTVKEHGQSPRVYDLTVEDDHEFFCEAHLVSNCIDALRYACEGVRRAQNVKSKSVHPVPVANSW